MITMDSKNNNNYNNTNKLAINNSEEIDSKLNDLQIWFENNPKLPEKIERIVLHRFLKCISYDIEAAKAVIELNYSMRNKSSNIFIDRNLDDEATAKAILASDLLILPGVTPEHHRLILFRLADFDPSSRNPVEEAKVFFMMTDAHFTMPDDKDAESKSNESIADGDVQIVDIAGYTMRHIAYISISVQRMYMKFLQEAYPSRLRAMHVINCPPFLDRMVAIMKPFIRKEVYDMITFHTEGLDSLYEFVPRSMLPEEYGGTAGTVAQIKAQCIDKMKEKSSYLRDEKFWKVAPQSRGLWSWF